MMRVYTLAAVLMAGLVPGCANRGVSGDGLPAVGEGPLAVGLSSVPAEIRAGTAFDVRIELRNLSRQCLAVPRSLSTKDGFGVLRLHGAAGLERREGVAPETTFLSPEEVVLLEPGEGHSSRIAVPGSLTSRLPDGDYALVAGLIISRGVTEDTGMIFHGAAFSRPVAFTVLGGSRR